MFPIKSLNISILISSTLLFGCSYSPQSPHTHYAGKYCETPSRCDNPMVLNGVVTSPNYLASEAGLKVLREGGNAVDAAIAASAVLSVVYPHMTTIGGDNFWLIYNAKTGELSALNASGRAGEKATIDFYRQRGLDKIPARGYLAANTVPGAVSGWDEAYRYAKSSMGTKQSWKNLFASAIDYAHDGFVVSHSLAHWSIIDTNPDDQEFYNLQRFDGFRQTYLKANAVPYRVGEILKQPQLARTLTQLANNGAKEFYSGSIAKAIVADLQSHGGVLTLNDFARHRADWVQPISVDYRQYRAYNFPPNTQGMASLEILNILNNFDVAELGEGTANYYHLIVEATKEAFADRDRYLSDPDFVEIPLEQLLSKAHGKQQAKRINFNHAANSLKPLDPKGDTIWLGVVDAEGNAVSLIQSIYHDFGSGIVAGNTGVLLQNRGSFFSLNPQHVNHLEPNKRTFHTLSPAMLLKDGKPYLVYGTMGGEGQPQTQAAMVTRIIDFGMSPQEAINAPRWLHGRMWGASSNDLKIEGRVPAGVTQELQKRGHPINVVDDFTDTMGHAGAILIDPVNHVRKGATDPRGDGTAVGY